MNCTIHKLLLIILFLTSSFQVSAQDFFLSTDSMYLEFGEYIDYNDFSIINNGSAELEIAVKLENICSEDDTKIQLCIGALCFFPTNETMIWGEEGDAIIKLEPNDSLNIMKFTPMFYENFGSEWNVVFFDRNNPETESTLSVFLDECNLTVNTHDIPTNLGKAYPNPAQNIITIPYHLNFSQSTQLRIVNTSGIEIKTIDLIQGEESITVNLNNYNSGLYYYYFLSDEYRESRIFSFVKK